MGGLSALNRVHRLQHQGDLGNPPRPVANTLLQDKALAFMRNEQKSDSLREQYCDRASRNETSEQ